MHHHTRRLAVGALMTTLALGSLAACSDDIGSDDDTLVVYVGRDEGLVGPLLDQFTEETGVEIDARYAATPDSLALLLEEGDATPADVFLSQDAGALGTLSREGMLTTLPDSVTDKVQSAYSSTDGTWVGVTARARVIAYNGEELEADEVPDTVAALTDEKWKGRVGMPPSNASFQSFVTGFRAAEGDDAARAWLEGMVDNDVQTFENNNDTLEAIENGTVDLGLINHYYVFGLRAELGEDEVVTELKFPKAGDPGALVNVSGVGALSDHPDAETLIDWLVGTEAQEYFVDETFEYPVVEGIEAPEGLPPLSSLQGPVEDLADLDDVEATLTMLEEVGLS